MKYLMKIMLLVVILASLAGCGGMAATATTAPVSGTPGYPAAAQSGSAYPAGNVPGATVVPAYMLPGFITATPDPALADVIISEVRHEGGLETIVIKNISSSEKDISAFMLYAPELNERVILPSGIKLASGATFEMYNGEAADKPAGQVWLPKPVLQKALDEIWLLNSAARIIFYFVYYPPVTQ